MLFGHFRFAPEGEGGGGAPEGGTDTTQATDQGGEKFAGKYEGHDQALQGVNEARQKIGLDPIESNLYGEGGVFADQKAAEQHYKDLTAIMRNNGKGGDQQTDPKPDPPADAKGGEAKPEGETSVELGGDDATETPDNLTVEQVVEKAGLDMQTLGEQYEQHGKLTDEQYEALKKVDPTMTPRNVNQIAEGRLAQAKMEQRQAEETKQSVFSMVGGEQAYQNLAQWAKQNLTQAEQQWYDQQVAGENVTQQSIEGAVTWLKQKHANATGSSNAGHLANGDGSAGPTKPNTPKEIKALLERSKRGDAAADEELNKVDKATLARMI